MVLHECPILRLLSNQLSLRSTISVPFCDSQQLLGLFDPDDRQACWVQQPDLHEERGLVPPDVLMCNLPVLESHYHDVRKFHFLSSWRDPWQQVIPLCVVSKTHNKFVHYLVFADGAGDGRDLRIFGDLIYEVLAVKTTDFLAAGAPASVATQCT